MVDIHNHILYGVDDGCKTIEESLEALKIIAHNGYTDIILTPHYMEGNNYCSSKSENMERVEVLRQKLTEENIPIHIYLGNEVYIDDHILEWLKDGTISTLNNSKYLLIEFPLWSEVSSVHNIVFELVSYGFVPVIAHPERYRYYHHRIEVFEQLIKEGALLQGNIGSLYGLYGKDCQHMLEKLLKEGMITFLSSDIHGANIAFPDDLRKRLFHLTKDKDEIECLLNTNMMKVIYHEKI